MHAAALPLDFPFLLWSDASWRGFMALLMDMAVASSRSQLSLSDDGQWFLLASLLEHNPKKVPVEIGTINNKDNREEVARSGLFN